MMRRHLRTSVLVLCACASTIDAAAAPVERFALVVGNNEGQPDLPRLRYADDDAAHLERFLSAAGYTTRLLTVLDEDTQTAMPGAVARSRPPTRASLDEAMAELGALMQKAKAQGREVELVFAFAGHGRGSKESGGAIFLLDGALTRQDLVDHVVARSPADYNHVIVDACDSYFMVAARGADDYPDDRAPSSDADALARSYLEGDGVMNDPRTGFIVSTNHAAQSHEHDAFRAGVFSYVVRSALAGAADADGDGRIEYSEVMAYAAAASQRISDPRARLSIFGRGPPRNVHRPLLDIAQSDLKHFLRFGPELEGRIHVEGASALRYADFHKTRGSELLLALVGTGGYTVIRGDDEAHVSLRRPGAIRVERFALRRALPRGVVQERLHEELFAVPYDASFYRGYVASRALPVARGGARFNPPDAARTSFMPPRPRFVFAAPGLGLVALGGVLGVGAGVTTVATKFFFDQYVRKLKETGLADARDEAVINGLRVATGLLVAAGMAGIAAGAILVAIELLWPARSEEDAP